MKYLNDAQLFTADGKRKYLTPEERHAFLAAARRTDPPIRLLCEVLAYTGCRLSEALQLHYAQVDDFSGALTLLTLKRRRRVYRQVPIPHHVLLNLVRRGARRRPHMRVWRMHRQTAWRHVKAVMDRADVHGYHATPRGLRHAFALTAWNANVPPPILQRWMGHKSLETTSIYSQLIGPEERAFAERMWLSHQWF